jgi:type II secretory pathway predicted ATPase ExeA
MTWLDHFGLSRPPFSKAIDDADLWLTSAKRDALDEIAEAIDERATAILLVGDSGLGKSCVLRALHRSLWTRIHTRLKLPEPEPGDTVGHVRHRLQLAGVERELFSSDALALLHEGSAGRLRDIDRLASATLKLAARGQHNIVDRGIILNVATSQQR